MIWGVLILALFFSCELAMLYDLDCAGEEDSLWDEEEVAATWRAEA